MFDIGGIEFILLILVAIFVIPPKDFPKVLRFFVDIIRRIKSFIVSVSDGISDIVDEAGVDEMTHEFKKDIDQIKSGIKQSKHGRTKK